MKCKHKKKITQCFFGLSKSISVNNGNFRRLKKIIFSKYVLLFCSSRNQMLKRTLGSPDNGYNKT